MNSNSLVSISDISKEEILRLLNQARYFEEHPNHRILEGKVVATLFLSHRPVHDSVSRLLSTALAVA